MAHKQYRQVLGHVTQLVPEHGHERLTHTLVYSEIERLLGAHDACVADGLAATIFHVPDETRPPQVPSATPFQPVGYAPVKTLLSPKRRSARDAPDSGAARSKPALDLQAFGDKPVDSASGVGQAGQHGLLRAQRGETLPSTASAQHQATTADLGDRAVSGGA